MKFIADVLSTGGVMAGTLFFVSFGLLSVNQAPIVYLTAAVVLPILAGALRAWLRSGDRTSASGRTTDA